MSQTAPKRAKTSGVTETEAAFVAREEHCTVKIDHASLPCMDDLPDGTVLIRAQYATICGSDMLYLEKPRQIDWCCGCSVHEAIGVVVSVKGEDAGFKEGDQVLALPSNYMRSGIFRNVDPALATELKKIPLSGGLARHFLSHTSHMWAIPKGGAIPPHQVSHYVAAQPIGTILWMLRKVPNLIHKTVLVQGQGQNGLLATHLLSNMGARNVIAVDTHPERLEVAKKMKATHTVLAGDHETVVAAVHEITGGAGADIVFEMVGHQEQTINECLDLVKEGGKVYAFGVPRTPVYPFEFSKLFRRNVELIGCVFPEAQVDFPFGLEMLAQGRLDVSPIFTNVFPLEAAQAAYDLVMKDKAAGIKVILDLRGDGEATAP